MDFFEIVRYPVKKTKVSFVRIFDAFHRIDSVCLGRDTRSYLLVGLKWGKDREERRASSHPLPGRSGTSEHARSKD